MVRVRYWVPHVKNSKHFAAPLPWDDANSSLPTLVPGTVHKDRQECSAYHSHTILFAREHNNQDQMWLIKIAEYIVFCVCRGSWLVWSPVILFAIPRRVIRGNHRLFLLCWDKLQYIEHPPLVGSAGKPRKIVSWKQVATEIYNPQ